MSRIKVKGEDIREGDTLCGYGLIKEKSRWADGYIVVFIDHEHRENVLGIRRSHFYEVERGQLALDLWL